MTTRPSAVKTAATSASTSSAKYPETKELVADLTDEQIFNLRLGGHDDKKLYAAFKEAMETKGKPTVILAQSIKGAELGPFFEARNSTHQIKKFTMSTEGLP